MPETLATHAYSSGRRSRARERGISAVPRADETHAFRIGDALCDRGPKLIGHVVLHAQAPLATANVRVRDAEAGRAAKLRLKHGIAARCEKVRSPVEDIGVAILGPVMEEHDERQTLCGTVDWSSESRDEFV